MRHQLMPLMVSVSQTYSFFAPAAAHRPSRTAADSDLDCSYRSAFQGFFFVWQMVSAPWTLVLSLPLAWTRMKASAFRSLATWARSAVEMLTSWVSRIITTS